MLGFSIFFWFVLRKFALHTRQRGAGNAAARPAPLGRTVPVCKHRRADSGTGKHPGSSPGTAASSSPLVLPRLCPRPPRGSGHPRGAGSRRLRCVCSRRTGGFATNFLVNGFRPDPPAVPAAAVPGELPGPPGAAGAPRPPAMGRVTISRRAEGGGLGAAVFSSGREANPPTGDTSAGGPRGGRCRCLATVPPPRGGRGRRRPREPWAAGAGLCPQPLRTAAAPAPPRPKTSPGPAAAAARNHRSPDVRPPGRVPPRPPRPFRQNHAHSSASHAPLTITTPPAQQERAGGRG